jgi:hypothetical protein
MRFVLPQGIGDCVWALFKIRAIRDAQDPGGAIDVRIACSATSNLESRALDFVRRFPFVDSAEMFVCGGLGSYPPVRPDGRYNYIEDGWYDFDGERYCVLVPNAALERGERLETWLPHYPIDWSIFDGFHIAAAERRMADKLHASIGDYAVFYPGPLMGNTTNGHNRNALWRPADWVELGRQIRHDLGLRIVVVGASYDESYYAQWRQATWTDLIGGTSLGELWSVTSRSRFVVSYQAGVGIVSTYLGTPTAIFWRPEGDSISPDFLLTFSEAMASAWVPPAILASGKHLPCIYKRDGVEQIMKWARRWAT